MEENKIIKLFTGEKVKTKDREFTKLLGGFSQDKPSITDKQIAELLGYAKGARAVRQRLENANSEGKKNIEHFEFGQDILDLKSSVPEKDTMLNTLKTLGYTEQSINLAKNIYIFSESGFLLYLKFAEGDKAVELYKDFIEDYFKTKAENIVMEKTLEESKQTIIDERIYILGSVIFEKDTTKKMELLERDRKLEEQLNEIERTLAKEELMKQVQDQLEIANRFTNSNKLYDIGEFSKILDIPKFGRTNLFRWLRDNKMLMSNNIPYANQMDHFKIIAIENNRFTDSKTLIKAKGISYIVKKLIKDGKIQSKSYEDIIKNIDENLKQAN